MKVGDNWYDPTFVKDLMNASKNKTEVQEECIAQKNKIARTTANKSTGNRTKTQTNNNKPESDISNLSDMVSQASEESDWD